MLFIERVHILCMCMHMYNVQCMHPLYKKNKKMLLILQQDNVHVVTYMYLHSSCMSDPATSPVPLQAQI